MPDAERLIEVFSATKRCSGAERWRFLAEVCGDDPTLHTEVRSLLEADEAREDADFLKTPPPLPNLDLLTEKPGDVIDQYRLREKIGEGGCGVVYRADQEHPVRRQVALKILKLGMDTKEIVARFERERQALALMEHPNIAKVFDAGATHTRRPYFVMELVAGRRITSYCDEKRLGLGARLKLFIDVCLAVKHAHQKGIIHRDIKPSNIRVAEVDGAPVPKVIDFGIAKATAGELTDKTRTRHGALKAAISARAAAKGLRPAAA